MKFYNRKSELEELHLIENLSNESAQLAVVVGRRRVGNPASPCFHTNSSPLFLYRKKE